MKIKNIFILIFILFLISLFSGCSEQQQIHQKLIIQGIGVDSCDSGYLVTVQALDFKNPAGEDEPNVKTLEISGVSLVEALENISKQTSLNPIYSQNLILIINEEIAKNGISNFMDFFIRHCEARPKVKICVTQNKASEIFKLKSGNKPVKSKDISELIPDALHSDILHFVSDLKSSIVSPSAAWIEIAKGAEGETLFLKGIGLFLGENLKEFCEGDEALGFTLLKAVPNFEGCTISAPDIGQVTCLIDKVSSDVDAKVDDGTPRFNICLHTNVSIFSTDNKFNSYFDENIKGLIRESLSVKIKNACVKIIDKCKKLGCDALNWGRILKNSNPRYFKDIENSWSSYMKESGYIINVDIDIGVTGKEPL